MTAWFLLDRLAPAFNKYRHEKTSSAKLRFVGTGLASLADQGVVSAGNFLLNVILARTLSVADYGVFVVIFALFTLISTAHGALVVYPLTLAAASPHRAETKVEVRKALWSTIALFGPCGLLVAGVLAVVRSDIHAALSALVMVIACLCQEVTRRSLMAQLRHLPASLGDAVFYLGRCAVVWALAGWGAVSLFTAYGALDLAALGAIFVQCAQMGFGVADLAPRFGRIADFWRAGKWMLYSSMVNIVMAQGAPWILASFHGLQAVSEFQVIVTLVGICHPFLFGIGNFIVPFVAQQTASGSGGSARGLVAASAALLLPIFLYLAAVAFAPRLLIEMVYGRGTSYLAASEALGIMALAYVLLFPANIIGSIFLGRNRARSNFIQGAAGTLAGTIVGFPLMIIFGVTGAAIAVAIGAGVRLTVALLMLMAEEAPRR